MELPFLVFDFFVYANVSKKLHLLLKGLSVEAKWHSTMKDYTRNYRIAKIFYITRGITVFAFIIFIIIVIMDSFADINIIIQNSDCLLQYFIPNTPISFSVSE